MTRNRMNGNATAGSAVEAEPTSAQWDTLRAQIHALNSEYAFILVGDRPAVLQEEPHGPDGQPELRILTVDGFKQWLLPRRVTLGEEKKPVAPLWLASPDRREFRGLCFDPGRVVPGYYNLWKGFSVDPDPRGARGCARFLDHVAENVCQGDTALFAWVVGWFADIVQRPAKKRGTALVFRGEQGTGKSIVGETVGALLGPHYTPVADARYITGRFNAHLAQCLLLQAEEGFWAGDHAAEGKLKDLVTGDWHLIEYKGKEPVRVRNHVRLLVTSNARWVVPAGLEERRFAVVDVGDLKRQDRGYFAAIRREMEDEGGYGALLHYLLAYDTASAGLDEVPRTAALFDQKVQSLDAEAQWWLDVLSRGTLPGDAGGHGVAPCAALYAHYLEHARAVGVTRRAIETQLGAFLREWAPGVRRARRTIGTERVWAYELPPLAACRARFTVKARFDHPWPVDADELPGVEATWTAALPPERK